MLNISPEHAKRILRIDTKELAQEIQSTWRYDANESMTLATQLNYRRAKTYDIEYKQLKARKLIPIATDVPEGADTYSVAEWDEVGMAKLIANYADDLPLADAFSNEEFVRIYPFGVAYQYSIDDIRRSQFARTYTLPEKRATAARKAFERRLEVMAAVGDSAINKTGLLNNANVPIVSTPKGAWLGGVTTPAEILKDMNTLDATVAENSDEQHPADTLLLPIAHYGYIRSTPFSTTATDSILKVFLSNSVYIKNVDSWSRLSTAGAGGVTRMIAYQRDPEVVELVIPMEFRELQPEVRSLAIITNCIGRIGGVRFNRPLGAAYMDAI